MKSPIFHLLVVAAVAALFIPGVSADGQIPKTISYQGMLTDVSGTPVPDGTHSLTLSLYTAASGGTAVWSETQDVATSKGIFSTILGGVTPIDLKFDVPYWLGMTVGTGSEMTPRVQLTSGPYSMRSLRADTARQVVADYGATGSLKSGTPLGNGPGWIFTAPNGERRDFVVYNAGTCIDYKLYVNSDGNVGIGTGSWPGGKLGVDGDIYVKGNLTKSYSTGTRNNAMPIAYGTINSNGSVGTATPNVTCSWNGTQSWYEITIDGEDYFWQDYVTTVTAVPPTGPPVIASSGSVNNKLLVILQNTAGTNIQCMFSFVTYKP